MNRKKMTPAELFEKLSNWAKVADGLAPNCPPIEEWVDVKGRRVRLVNKPPNFFYMSFGYLDQFGGLVEQSLEFVVPLFRGLDPLSDETLEEVQRLFDEAYPV